MTSLLYANNAVGTLASAITNSATSLTLNAGQAALFPNPGAGQAFYGTLTDAATQTLKEIVLATSVSGNIVSITRAQDGTSARSWNAGDIFEQCTVAAELRAFAANGQNAAFDTLSATGNDALLYNNNSAQSIPNLTPTIVTGWTQLFDRLGTNFNATTGVFTAPANGYYQVSAGLLFTANTGAPNTSAQTVIVANGVNVAAGFTIRENNATAGEGATVSSAVFLSAGQTLTINAVQNSGAALTLQTGPGVCFLSIASIP